MAYTSFFRDRDVLDLIASQVIPTVSTFREILVWDAGCSTGEETYSLAILFAENTGPFSFRNLRIMATDREESAFPQFETAIRAGRYHRKDLLWVPETLRNKYFVSTEDPETYQIAAEIKECVQYLRHDLLSFKEIRANFCLIVCKNVLMHFSVPMQAKVIEMFHRGLKIDGYFATDHSQTIPAEVAHLFKPVYSGRPLYQKVSASL
jgi:chemotaxis protein methyltransferase CheR